MYLPECIADVTGNLLMMKGNLVDINHACIEAALTIGQIQLPHALKAVVKCLILQLIGPSRQKPLPPLPQGMGIIRPISIILPKVSDWRPSAVLPAL